MSTGMMSGERSDLHQAGANSGSAREASPAACLNCGAMPAGPWCQACGQKAGPAHRSMLHLGAELMEIVSHADSRLWRTLRWLAVDPAGLTLDYLRGRRASEIPPLRLFFVMMLLAFTVGSVTGETMNHIVIPADQQAKVVASIAKLSVGWRWADGWLHTHLDRAVARPEEVVAVMREWSERFTIAMLPIAALMLWVLYLPRRGFSLYDHVVVCTHSLSFVGLVFIASFLLGAVWSFLGVLVLLTLPVHLFVHLRGVYRRGVPGTLIRMALLALGTSLAMTVLLAGLAGLGLQLGTEN